MVHCLPFFISLAAATNLYATHYNGNVYSLSLDGENSLSVTSSSKTCGDAPSWLTFDSSTRTIYCSDHAGNASMNGLLSSYSVNQDGGLTELASTVDVGAAVHSIIYGGKHGREKYLAIAHYGGSALSTFSLPLKSDKKPLEVFHYKMSQPGIKPQQDSPHPHQVILDPTGDFILVPDLGADQVRVYAINQNSGHLNVCPSLNYTAGSGPRHGLFWKSDPLHSDHAPVTMLYTVSELGGHFNAFAVSYLSSGCLGFKETQSFVPYPGGQLPAAGTPAELRMSGNYLYASIRFDQGFAPNDSMSTMVRSPNGTVSFSQITSAYGTVPRTFAINKKGTLVAIGDQVSSNVAIVERNPRSGALGNLIANLEVTQPGQASISSSGLSSIIWEE
ncbi:Lactonase, 7-bladed beta propeller [Penicillium expansum]|nr:Lactonase, 7-bladed beta propeller [Penicillium expansum]